VQTKCGFDDTPQTAGHELLVAHGPTLLVHIGFDPKYNVATGRPPEFATDVSHALVDTGATESCIDSKVATALALPMVDRRPISGIGGAKLADICLAQIFVPSLAITIYGPFAVVELAAGGQLHAALIGRTFLRHFKMVYEGTTGTVTLER
jgi:predicted aspartyl protease